MFYVGSLSGGVLRRAVEAQTVSLRCAGGNRGQKEMAKNFRRDALENIENLIVMRKM